MSASTKFCPKKVLVPQPESRAEQCLVENRQKQGLKSVTMNFLTDQKQR